MRAAMRLGLLIGFEFGAIAGLHALGDLPWLRIPSTGVVDWATITPAEDVVATAARLLALACCYWLLASTVCYTLAVAARLPGAVRVAGWATLPAVRRVAERAVAMALVTSSVMGPSTAIAAAAPVASVQSTPQPELSVGPPLPPEAVVPPAAPPPSSPADSHPAPPADARPAPPTDSRPALGAPAPLRPPAVPPPDAVAPPPDRGDPAEGTRPPTPDAPTDLVHEVEPGDNLWSITATYLEAAGAEADDTAIHAVWVEVVEANRDRLRSGDPDLIYPGETITLSPIPEHGTPSNT